jgi:hypothetical protein
LRDRERRRLLQRPAARRDGVYRAEMVDFEALVEMAVERHGQS